MIIWILFCTVFCLGDILTYAYSAGVNGSDSEYWYLPGSGYYKLAKFGPKKKDSE